MEEDVPIQEAADGAARLEAAAGPVDKVAAHRKQDQSRVEIEDVGSPARNLQARLFMEEKEKKKEKKKKKKEKRKKERRKKKRK